ncbi:MAG: hypothetical protein ABJA81_00750 [Nocardioidaceae bacterium]
MAPLGALSQSWVTAEGSLPLGWHITGLRRSAAAIGSVQATAARG